MNDYTDHDQLIKHVALAVGADPLIVPRLLDVISARLASFADAAKRASDQRLVFAATVAHALPARPIDWNPQNKQHSTVARIVANGLRIRQPSNDFERMLLEFVKFCDAADPEGSAAHYKILNGDNNE